jgi:hypothetical protein
MPQLCTDVVLVALEFIACLHDLLVCRLVARRWRKAFADIIAYLNGRCWSRLSIVTAYGSTGLMAVYGQAASAAVARAAMVSLSNQLLSLTLDGACSPDTVISVLQRAPVVREFRWVCHGGTRRKLTWRQCAGFEQSCRRLIILGLGGISFPREPSFAHCAALQQFGLISCTRGVDWIADAAAMSVLGVNVSLSKQKLVSARLVESLAFLAHSPRAVHLTTVKLVGVRLPAHIFQQFVSLRTLALTCADIYDPAALSACASLTSLDLTYTLVRPDSLRAFAQMPSLESLTLRFCSLIDDVGPLQESLSLRYLNICGTPVAAEGLAGLERIPTLQHVDARGCRRLATVPHVLSRFVRR